MISYEEIDEKEQEYKKKKEIESHKLCEKNHDSWEEELKEKLPEEHPFIAWLKEYDETKAADEKESNEAWERICAKEGTGEEIEADFKTVKKLEEKYRHEDKFISFYSHKDELIKSIPKSFWPGPGGWITLGILTIIPIMAFLSNLQ